MISLFNVSRFIEENLTKQPFFLFHVLPIFSKKKLVLIPRWTSYILLDVISYLKPVQYVDLKQRQAQ